MSTPPVDSVRSTHVKIQYMHSSKLIGRYVVTCLEMNIFCLCLKTSVPKLLGKDSLAELVKEPDPSIYPGYFLHNRCQDLTENLERSRCEESAKRLEHILEGPRKFDERKDLFRALRTRCCGPSREECLRTLNSLQKSLGHISYEVMPDGA